MPMTEKEKQAALAAIQADREANPDAYKPEDDGQFNWDDIAAGGYSAANSALFGIPDILVKAASSDAYKELQNLRAKNRAATTVGDIAGAFIPTGGLLAKGAGSAVKLGARGLEAAKAIKAAEMAGKVAKGLDTAGDIISGAKKVSGLGGAVGRGALAATEASVPRLLSGDLSGKDTLKSAALGGAVGGASYGVGKAVERIPELFQEAQNWANKTILKRSDITSRVMRAQQEYMGGDVKKYTKDLADLADELELHREPKLDEMIDNVKSTWREMGDKFDASGFTVDPQKVIDAGDVTQAIKRDAGVMDSLNDIITKTDATDGFANKRSYLQEIIFSDKASADEKKIARSVLEQIENKAEQLSGLDIGKAKEQWKLMKPFEMADKMKDMAVSGAGIKGGSDTAFKLALGGLGATAAGSTQLKGVIDDPTNPQSWEKLLTATGGGALAGIANKQLGIMLAKAIRKIPTDKISEIAGDIANNKLSTALAKLHLEDITPAAGKFITGKLADNEMFDKMDQSTEPVSQETNAIDTTGQISNNQTLSDKTSEPDQTSKGYSQVYYDKLNDKMVRYWAAHFASTMSYEDYVNKVADLTNNFDPTKTANFLYSDKKERAKFLRDYALTNKLKGIDVSKAFAKPGLIEGVLDPNNASAQRKTRSDLVDNIAQLVTTEGDLPSKSTIDVVNADINAIMSLNANSDEKRQLLINKLTEKYGLNYQALKDLGLV